jgi:SPFH domain / Band 7 family
VDAFLAFLVLAALVVVGGYVAKKGLYTVPDRMVGIVYRRFGQHPGDRYRVRTHGSAGPQAETLEANRRYWLPPLLVSVRFVEQTFVPDGTIGLVEAKAGAVRPPGRRLCRYVECDYFQDGVAFLHGSGEQGRQSGVLPGGAHYSINTELFDVVTVDTLASGTAAPANPGDDRLTAVQLHEINVPVGNTGVVIVLDGEPPDEARPDTLGPVVPGHHSFRRPWVFLAGGGHRGVQEETLTEGSRYAINPWFARVVLIPTRELHLEWTKRSEKTPGNLDSALDQIIVDIEGHRLSLDMSQVLRIPAKTAPRLVRRFGEMDARPPQPGEVTIKPAPVQRFVERVLGAAVAGYFTALVGRYTILEFIEEYEKVRLELQYQVTAALSEWEVVAGHTVLAEFESEDREIYDLRRRIARAREQKKISRYELDSIRIDQEKERILIKLHGERQVAEIRELAELLGPQQIAIERVAAHLANMGVPTYISGGDDLAQQILGLMPFASAKEMLNGLIQGLGAELPPSDMPRQIDDAAEDHPPSGPDLDKEPDRDKEPDLSKDNGRA